ncbi:MAG: hypothetical protein ABIT01_16115, partial [Thermoanaerobaculia bacterium]
MRTLILKRPRPSAWQLVVALALGSVILNPVALAQTSRYERLLEAASRNGSVRIIVGLRLSGPFVPDGALNPAQASAQRANIASKQAQFSQAMRIGQEHHQHSYQYIPFVALSATSSIVASL